MNKTFDRLVHHFYEARRNNDENAIRAMLAEDVIWHEPKVNEHTGDLHGREAILQMFRQAQAITEGTFLLKIESVLSNNSHAVALIKWSATKAGNRIEGSEFAIFRIEAKKIKEVWFFQQDMRADEAFWSKKA